MQKGKQDIDQFDAVLFLAGKSVHEIYKTQTYRHSLLVSLFKGPLNELGKKSLDDLFDRLAAAEQRLIPKWPQLFPSETDSTGSASLWLVEEILSTHRSRFASRRLRSAKPTTEEGEIIHLQALRFHTESEISRCQTELQTITERLSAVLEAESKIQKERRERARISALLNRARSGVEAIKVVLPRDHPCPYCGGPLGHSPHADHIHPVAKGGLSTMQNMVYICAQCNSRKSHMTLTAFAAKEGRDLTEILARLRALGKEF